jgi:type I restriction enzyme S subunit
MTILEFFKNVHPSVLAAKMIFRHLQEHYPVQKIADIADTSSGGTPNRGMIEYYNGDIPWVKSGELKDSLITKCDEYITESGLKNSSAKLFPKGTLLVAMYGANIGKTGVLDFDATTNQAVCAIFPKVKISKEFLFWYFKQQRIDFIAIGKGGAQPNISQTIINNASIVVPDEKTQKKIVDFLNGIEQGNGVDTSFFIPEVLKDVKQIYKYKNSYVTLSDSFENQLNQLENLNQAILQETVQGKLVAQDKKDEPASELLKRIKEEKAKSGKKEKPLPPIKTEEIPFEIPVSWSWCRLGDITDYGSSPKAEPSDLKNDTWVLDLEDIEKTSSNLLCKIRFNERNSLSTKSRFKAGDVLYSKLRPYLDKVIVADEDGVCTTEILPLKCYADLNPHYFKYSLKRNDFLKYVNSVTKGMKMPRLGTKEGQLALIPIPPLSEQKRIVAEIEKQLAKTKQLKEHIIANQQATEQLLKALLHQAFEVEEMDEV